MFTRLNKAFALSERIFLVGDILEKNLQSNSGKIITSKSLLNDWIVSFNEIIDFKSSTNIASFDIFLDVRIKYKGKDDLLKKVLFAIDIFLLVNLDTGITKV